MKPADVVYLLSLASTLDERLRNGAARDLPEGARIITISDTLATEISARLRLIVASERA